MCLRRADQCNIGRIVAVTLALSCVCPAVAAVATHVVSADDTTESDELQALTEWLTQAGLADLLAVVLAEHLGKSPTTAPMIVSRLADAYVRLLNQATDEDRVLDLRVRILKFLSADRAGADAVLRLALARAEYRIALKDIERLGRGEGDPEIERRVTAALGRTIEPLAQLDLMLAARVEASQRRAGGAEEQDRVASLLEADEGAQQRLQAQFLRAWCHYWALWMSRLTTGNNGTPSPQWLREGEKVTQEWSMLLETGKPFPEPSDTSVDLRGEEYYAQSILGMALTKALVAGMANAQPWFALLEGSAVWGGLSNLAPWRLQAFIDAREYDAATRLTQSDAQSLSCAQVIGAATRAFAQSKGGAESLALAQSAIEFAAAAGELLAVRAITAKIPALAHGDGFAPALARGVEAYELGRAAADGQRKKPHFERAVRELVQAVSLAPANARTASAVEELLAWARMGTGELCDASAAFASASAQLSGSRAERLLWMAAQSASQGACVDEQGVARGRAFALAREYLRSFPDGDHASDAAASLASDPAAQYDDVLVERLLRRAAAQTAIGSAREAAALLLYRRFRAAQGKDRAFEAQRLLTLAPSAPSKWDADAIDIVLRQQLEAALDGSVQDSTAAEALLNLVASRYPIGSEPLEFRSEFAVRRLALAIALDDPTRALEAIGVARATSDATWRPVAEALFVRAMERMLARNTVPPERIVAGMMALVESRRVLLDTARRSGDSKRADAANLDLGRDLLGAAQVLRVCGDAVSASAREGEAQELATQALAIARDVLDHRPDDAQAFALMADAGMACSDYDAAFEALSRLVGGLPSRSDAWFERKADLCEVLAKSNPEQAKKVLAQHVVLIPNCGPGLGGERLRALALRLGVTAPPAPKVAP
ncbi:MAG: hypothetical protein EXS17_02825 [Phycisphaerales bacterium]|nr:hypothetical protein [Phycisphaerales bacterium]